MQLKWIHCLGKLQYPRRVRLCFFEKGNYVDMAKRYRQHVKETGHFVGLKEKIARNPLVERLIGCPVIHTGILSHIQPESRYYHKDDPAKNHQLTTFGERAQQLRQLADKGFAPALVPGEPLPRAAGLIYVHLDGWGFRGYDNLHPDILPPCPEAGGWQGMKTSLRLATSLATSLLSTTSTVTTILMPSHTTLATLSLTAMEIAPTAALGMAENSRSSAPDWLWGTSRRTIYRYWSTA